MEMQHTNEDGENITHSFFSECVVSPQQGGTKMKKFCSYCGLETWACGCGGHCYNKKEHKEWKRLFEKEKEIKEELTQ